MGRRQCSELVWSSTCLRRAELTDRNSRGSNSHQSCPCPHPLPLGVLWPCVAKGLYRCGSKGVTGLDYPSGPSVVARVGDTPSRRLWRRRRVRKPRGRAASRRRNRQAGILPYSLQNGPRLPSSETRVRLPTSRTETANPCRFRREVSGKLSRQP